MWLGGCQGAGKVTHINSVYAEDTAAATWEITAPRYDNPVLLGFDPEASPTVITFFYDDEQEINDVYHALGGEYDSVNAFSYTEGLYCIIHMMRPTDWNDKNRMQTLGHEMVHCLGGKHITGLAGEIKPIPPIPATDDPIHTTTVIQPMRDTQIFGQSIIVVQPVQTVQVAPIVIVQEPQPVDVTVTVLSPYEVAVLEGDIRGAIKALVQQFKERKLQEAVEKASGNAQAVTELKSRGII